MWKLFWIYHRLSFGRTHIMHITVSSTSCIFFVSRCHIRLCESRRVWLVDARARACTPVQRDDAPMHSIGMCWCGRCYVARQRCEANAIESHGEQKATQIVGTYSESGLFVVIYWLVCRTWKNWITKRHMAAKLPCALRYLHAIHSHHTFSRSIDAATHSDWFYLVESFVN